MEELPFDSDYMASCKNLYNWLSLIAMAGLKATLMLEDDPRFAQAMYENERLMVEVYDVVDDFEKAALELYRVACTLGFAILDEEAGTTPAKRPLEWPLCCAECSHYHCECSGCCTSGLRCGDCTCNL